MAQIIPDNQVNVNKEYARYSFKPAGGKSWSVYRKGKFVGIYTGGYFEAVRGYENLHRFVYTALTRQYQSATDNRQSVNQQTLAMFGIRDVAAV